MVIEESFTLEEKLKYFTKEERKDLDEIKEMFDTLYKHGFEEESVKVKYYYWDKIREYWGS